MQKKTSLALALACSAVLLAACGKEDTQAPTAPPPVGQAPAPVTAPEPAPAPAATPAPAADAGAAASAATAVATGAAPVANTDAGKSVYGKTCALCHAAGVAGAPKPGDKADWGPRIAQGKDTLYKHAIEGYTGSKGVMPPKGGATSLSDDDVKAAVDYMVAQSS